MPNCVIRGCKNQTSRDKKLDGITFHIFPFRDQNIKEKWVAVIRNSRKEPSWQPSSRSVVCSAHFNSDDLYYTKKGLRRVLKSGYPKILPNVIQGSDNVDLSQPPCVKEEPPALDPPNDLNFSQPSGSCAILPKIIKGSDNVYLSHPPSVKEEPASLDPSNDLNFSQPYSSYAKEEPAALNFSNDLNFCLQPSGSCAVQPVQSNSSVFDILRNHKLQERVSSLEKNLEKYKRKIKTLNQKVRRLHKRNKYLREKLDDHIIEY
ncbi:unnamed protein product [Arctia plantaginis]|uniref:THAP-type domain-containing protein n=1 Tax=Arctia plantaginis TaxID=874455 RepID=A0A8S0ZVQ4_ARCPL|nr:unnamed protein product [Arctia plantaginis]